LCAHLQFTRHAVPDCRAVKALFILGFVMKVWGVGSQMDGQLTVNASKTTPWKNDKKSSTEPD